MKVSLPILALFAIVIIASTCQSPKVVVDNEMVETVSHDLTFAEGSSVLVFYKTDGFVHKSITAGRTAIKSLGEKYGFSTVETDDAAMFTEDELSKYDAVVFLNTTGDVLDAVQQDHFERYIQAGGGYAGLHAAADTEYGWPWYGNLVGGYFNGHPNGPNVRSGELTVVDANHASSSTLPTTWTRSDEWYSYKTFNKSVNVTLTVDESTYMDEVKEEYHPISWYHDFDGGRAFYTGLGHTEASYTEEQFLNHLAGGIHYAVGNADLDYSKANVKPEQNRFVKEVYLENLAEPMEVEMLPDGTLIVIERKGAIYTFDPTTSTRTEVTTLPVHSGEEDGLIGIAVDPNYSENSWIYLHYSPMPTEMPRQRLSRFMFADNTLNMESEKIMLEYKNQRDECCHAGGSLEFGPDGNLFVSAGDNTNPFGSDGFAPIDGSDGRSPWDGRGGPGNTNDLRGKIMRITPLADGTYSIPDGNLFAKDGSEGRPEIYVMGNRNPFRISIDPKTKYVYWGEIGPDAREDKDGRGPKGHDEINQARKAGNFGWPLFVGNNKPYNAYDFASKTSGPSFDPEAPVNDSPHNTGARILPPAQPAFIWYPYGPSEEFPLMGEGGRNAMAGPVFYSDQFENAGDGFPAYYDGKLIIYEWMRNFVAAVTMDENGDYLRMEHMMTDLDFSNTMDMMFAPDGSLIVLEYGKKWFSQNVDARLSRISYQGGNRSPIAKPMADQTIGAVPLTVAFDGSASSDPDEDPLKYEWHFEGADGPSSTTESPAHTFESPGVYNSRLKVTDESGNVSESVVTIYAGNAAPELKVDLGGAGFAIPGQVVNYEVMVSDQEDGNLESGIDAENVMVTIDFLPQGKDRTEIAQGHQVSTDASKAYAGEKLIAGSDCSGCHFEQEESIGPSHKMVAERYKDQNDAEAYLVSKIIKGGSGVWGDRVMAAHPSISEADARQMVQYIMSFAEGVEEEKGLPVKGSFTPDYKEGQDGSYVMMVSYTDKGATGAGPLTARETIVFKSPRIQAEDFDSSEKVNAMELPPAAGPMAGVNALMGTGTGKASYNDLDLSSISSIVFKMISPMGFAKGGSIEARSGSADGPLLGSLKVTPKAMTTGFEEVPMEITGEKMKTNVVLVFKTEAGNEDMVAIIDWIEFR